MAYSSYVRFLSQIASSGAAHISYQDILVLIEKGKKRNQWTLSAKVFIGEREIPRSIREAVSTTGKMQWQTEGPFLQLSEEEHTISLIHHIEGSLTFLPFRDHINSFTDIALEWRDTLDGFSESIFS